MSSSMRAGNAMGRDGKMREQVATEAAQESSSESINLLCSTTPGIPGRTVLEIKGIVCGEAIMGANFLRDLVAGITDIVGGRSGVYETKLRQGREIALREMMQDAIAVGGNAVVGVDIDYETIGDSMLMVSASGTAVVIEAEDGRAAAAVKSEP